MIGHHDGGLVLGNTVARDGDDGAIEALEESLDPEPDGICYGRGGVVDLVWEEGLERQEEGEEDVCYEEPEEPRDEEE